MTSFTLTGIYLALSLFFIAVFGWLMWKDGYRAGRVDGRYDAEQAEAELWEEAA